MTIFEVLKLFGQMEIHKCLKKNFYIFMKQVTFIIIDKNVLYILLMAMSQIVVEKMLNLKFLTAILDFHYICSF